MMHPQETKKILIIDDYEESCQALTELLGQSYDCSYTQDSQKAFGLVKDFKPDLVVIDYRMPGLMGTDVCEQIRKNETTRYLPVVFISGSATVDEKIRAFEMGADDFVSKPYHIKELILRIRRLIDKETDLAPDLSGANLRMNLIRRKVFVDQQEIQLTPKQFDILKMLLMNKNKIVSRETFLKEIWSDTEVTARNVDSQINYLKKKIEKFSGRIIPVAGQGYRLEIKN